MSPSPPTYTSLSTAQSSQSDYHQALLILFVVLPYFLITVLTPTTAFDAEDQHVSVESERVCEVRVG
jgi:hypothetical protein